MSTWLKLVQLSDAELSRCDIAAVNLACAQGLPGAESLDFGACRRQLDRWADQVRDHTKRTAYQFHRRPQAFNYSWAFFRAMDMVTVLQRDLGAHYTQALIEADDAFFFSRPENLFIHGPLFGKGGTCCSLPPLFIAVGRRLGYPLKMVHTFRHRFARWEGEEGEQFNIECTSRGMVSHSDEYYKTWPGSVSEVQIKRYGALQSQTPRQELATFLVDRGHCFLENADLRSAVWSYAHACNLDPDNWGHSESLVGAMNRWSGQIRSRLMPGFPPLMIHFPPRRFESIPKDLEQGMIHMITKEDLLGDRMLQEKYWEPLRRGGNLPQENPLAMIEVNYPTAVDGQVGIILHKSLPAYFGRSNLQPC